MDARNDDIEALAKSRLMAYCKMMIINDLTLAEFDPENKVKIDEIKASYAKEAYEKRIRESGYRKVEIDTAINDRLRLMEAAKKEIYVDADAKNVKKVKTDLEEFMIKRGKEIYDASRGKECHAAYILKVMYQVIANKVRDVEPVRLANEVMHFCSVNQLDANHAHEFVSMIKIMQLYILPALLLVDEEAIKTFMKTAEAQCNNGKLDSSLQIAILNALSHYIDNGACEKGTPAEKNIADLQHYERCLKLCETFNKSKTFKQPTKHQMFGKKKEDKATELGKIMQSLEGLIQHFKSEIELDRNYSNTSPPTKL